MRELSLHILDIMQNSIAAGATRVEINVDGDTTANRLSITITDNGKGMDAELLRKVRDPFTTTRTTRRVGLGIPMLLAASEACGGHLELESTPGHGTRISAVFTLNHIDRAPMGDITSTTLSAIIANPDISFKYQQSMDGTEFILDTDEIHTHLEEVPLSDPAVIRWMKGYISEGIDPLSKSL
ncbi:MAG: ATP-binding protein [Armatimonadota bacterium]